jgi:UDP-3-O-[3-hydroxymyristoyl] glucosamine N-acyltransferase
VLTGALAAALPATLRGPSDLEVTTLARLEDAGPTDLALALGPRYRDALRATRAGILVVSPALSADAPAAACVLVAAHPERALGRVLRLLAAPPPKVAPGVHPTALVHASARVHPEARLDPYVVVEADAVVEAGVWLGVGVYVGSGAHVGENTALGPRVVVHAGVHLGARCVVGAHAVLGGPGFGFDAQGHLPHLGGLIIGDDVHLGASTCVDRGTLGPTRIGDGARVDNLVQVGHNAQVGAGAVLCGQVGLAGGAVVEAGAVLGGQVGVAGTGRVGAGARVAAQAGVTRALEAGGVFSGHPAEPNRPRLVRLARLKRLADAQP